MAQTKRKRRRKHRGTQAGTIEAPGRTGRSRGSSPSSGRSAARGAGSARAGASRSQRPNRFDTPPTWRGSAQRAGIMAGLIVLALGLLQHNWAGAILLGVFALVLYVPATYYMDRAMYRRRQRQKQGGSR